MRSGACALSTGCFRGSTATRRVPVALHFDGTSLEAKESRSARATRRRSGRRVSVWQAAVATAGGEDVSSPGGGGAGCPSRIETSALSWSGEPQPRVRGPAHAASARGSWITPPSALARVPPWICSPPLHLCKGSSVTRASTELSATSGDRSDGASGSDRRAACANDRNPLDRDSPWLAGRGSRARGAPWCASTRPGPNPSRCVNLGSVLAGRTS